MAVFGPLCSPPVCKGSEGISGIYKPISRDQNHQEVRATHFWAEKLCPQASRWYTSWNRPGLSHISTSNPGPRPTPTCQVAEISAPSWVSIFSAPPIFPQPRPFPPKPTATPILPTPAGPGLTGSVARRRWAALCVHRQAPRGDPHHRRALCVTHAPIPSSLPDDEIIASIWTCSCHKTNCQNVLI